MKKILGTLATVLGLFGMASLMIYILLTPKQSTTTPRDSLTADIGAIVQDQPAETPAPTAPVDTAIATSSNATNIAITTTEIETTATTSPTADVVSPQPVAPVAEATPNPPPQPAPEPTAPSLPEATATITVTPTAPPPPPSSEPGGSGVSKTSLALPYQESNFTDDTNWQTKWGVATTTATGALELSAGTNSIGGSIYLQNTKTWSNYTMNATLSLISGHTFDLMADYVDASNYVACEYTETSGTPISMQLIEYVNGYETTLSPAVPTSWTSGSDISAAIEINGVYGTCSQNGQTVSNDGPGAGKAAMENPGSGTIGFGISDPQPNTSQIVIKNVSVK